MNKKRIIWLVLILVMALAMSACDSNDKDDSIGETLPLSGPVVNADWSQYTGPEKTFTTNAGGNGLITGSNMSITVPAPATAKLDSILKIFDSNSFPGVEISQPSTMALVLRFVDITLDRGYQNSLEDPTTTKRVFYIYADRDFTVTVPGNSSGDPIIISFKLSFKKGWNAIHEIRAKTGTSTTHALDSGDPKECKWVYTP
jgi:hypothetical protein